MASTAKKVSRKRKQFKLQHDQLKHSTKAYNSCEVCGRSRAYIRRFKMCRLCFREKAMNGELPGVRKASW